MAARACDNPEKQISSNLIFTVYQRMAERKQWAPYMKDVDEYMASFQELSSQTANAGQPTSSTADRKATEESVEENLFFHNANHIKRIEKQTVANVVLLTARFYSRYHGSS